MARLKIQLPGEFHFTCSIPVRITDINYGGHVGNDSVLGVLHEARMQFLQSLGYSEMNLAGVGTIMSDVAIEFKTETFYGDTLFASVRTGEISKIGFELYYKLEVQRNDKKAIVVAARTGMICYDYQRKKIVAVPDDARKMLAFSH